jgi:Xaa-Pro aminopeptidase
MSDAMLLVGDSASNPNLYYTTHFLAGDPFVYMEHDGQGLLVVSAMEAGRARKESHVGTVKTFDDYGYRDLVRELGDRGKAFGHMLARIVGDAGADRVVVEPIFPVFYADLLREQGLQVEVDPDLLVEQRRQKSAEEVEAIAAAQRAAERATQRALDMMAASEIRDGVLYYQGEPVTSERLREAVDMSLLHDNMETAHGSIIAPGPGAADPHWEGAGPIHAGEAVVMDIFPRGKSTRYFGDMTRTAVKGQPSETLQAMYDAVLKAQEAALAEIRPGANGKDVHGAVERVFADAGFAGEGAGPRYIHGTGHGVGLEIHEGPGLSTTDQELLEGDVVTVEPGLYDPDIGGVRIEDTVVVTADGYRNLNSLPKEFVL